jgi:hypothetical protein
VKVINVFQVVRTSNDFELWNVEEVLMIETLGNRCTFACCYNPNCMEKHVMTLSDINDVHIHDEHYS